MQAVKTYVNRLRALFEGQSLRDRTISGGAVLLLGEFYSNGIRLLANLAMTRLLYPEAFGVMLVINLVFTALGMLSDVGVRSAIIARKGELDASFINVAWTIMIVRGFCLTAIAMLLAKPIAIWYDHAQLFELILLASLAPAIAGFASPYPRVAERGVKLGRVTFWQTLTQTLAIAMTLVWLLIEPSVWALAANGVFSAVILTISSFLLFPSERLRMEWDNALAKELFHFGKWVLLGTSLTFLGRQGDSLVVSRYLDLELLGVFSIAISFAKLIEMLGEKLSWGLLFPVYSEMKNNPGDFAARTQRLRLAVYGICFPLVLILSLAGRDLIAFLYDSRYVGAGWMLEAMALGFGFYVLASTVNSIPLSMEDSRRHMWLQLLRVISVLSSMFVGGYLFGAVGLIWGISIGQIIYYPMLQIAVWRYGVRANHIEIAFGAGSILVALAVWSIRGWPSPAILAQG